MNPSTTAALDLRDIHAAAPAAFWPPAPGWWLLAALLIAALVLATRWLLRRHRQRREKRQIMDELETLSLYYHMNNSAEYIARLSTLLRRIALRRYPREQVASLTGTDWLRFLDATGGNGDFELGVGQVLEVGPYRQQSQDLPAGELLTVARRWVEQNIEEAA